MKLQPVILACDVGGTSIKLGLVRGGKLLERVELDALPAKGLAAALKRIARAARTLSSDAGLAVSQLDGFGLSFPGIVEPLTRRILSTPAGKFDDAKTLDVPKLVADLLDVPARVCNDANAALAGEAAYGAARGSRNVVMMTLGTGIGSAAMIEGVPLRGHHGQAGILGGHWTVNLHGRDCLCGNLGCSETESSTWALPALIREHPDFAASLLARERTLDFAAVFQAASQGDRVATEFRKRAIQVWSVTLVNLIHAYDPECAIIGGGVLRGGNIILTGLRTYVTRHAWTPWGKVKIKPAALGNDAGMFGVASLFQTAK
jgi:glucokinase